MSRALFNFARQTSRRSGRKHLVERRRLALEPLEDRSMLSVFAVTNLSDGVVTQSDDLPGSLRKAIFDADNNPGDDTITFDSSLAGQTITLTQGELDITDTSGTTTITGLGADRSTISGNNASRVFYINSGATVDISGLMITAGCVANSDGGSGICNAGTLTIGDSSISGNSTGWGDGGGISNRGTLTIMNCTVSDNSASHWGGGIHNDGTLTITGSSLSRNSAIQGGGISNSGMLTVADSALSRNSAGWEGGGIYNGGTLTITGSTISGNSADYGWGGGIGNGGTLTIIGSTVSGNSADYGGGISNMHGTVAVVNSSFSDNSASESMGGGGIENWDGAMMITDSTISGNTAYWGGGIGNRGTLTITGSTVSNNSATYGRGGGVENVYGTLTVSNSLFFGNSALGSSGGGGGIENWDGTVTIVGSTISGNLARCGGGIWNNGGGTLIVKNATITANPDGGIYNDDGNSTTTLGNTIVADNFGNDVQGTVTANFCLLEDTTDTTLSSNSSNNILNVDPLLGMLNDYGGSTRTIPLLPGSPAIDAGSNLLAVDAQGNPLSADQRGYARIVNGTVDIGACEFHYPKVIINQASTQADPANTSPINFTVVFNEAVTDFDADDVTLGGTAPGRLAAMVTGSGTTYNVAVSGMTGGGTVIASIAAGKAHDAAGSANSPSTSTDNAVDVVFAPISNIVVTAKTSADKTTITWMESDSSGLGTTKLTIDGAAAKIAKKASGKTAANFSYAGILKAGTHAYTIATKNGNGRSTTYTGTFTVNPTTPVISKISAKASTSDKMTSITWTVADVDSVGSTALSIDGVIITSGIKQSGKGSSLKYVYTGYLDAGSHTYTIDAADGLGVSAIQAGGSFDVKAATPTIKNVKVMTKTSADKTVITWTVGNLHCGWIALEIDGVAVTSGITQSCSGASRTFTYGGYFQAGKHAFTIDATDDTVDPISAKQAKGTFIVKATTPTISDIVVTATTADNPITITWNAYDVDGIGKVKLTIDGKTATIAPWGNSYTYSGNLSAGNHAYVITVTDTRKASSRIVGRFTVAAASLATVSRGRATTDSRGTVKTDWLIDYDSLAGVSVSDVE